ncbi:MAG: hypothetical protein J5790_01035 [Bacteroidaceae bacterium]|nr:hypothetical protein [Bacteroidaceae bacterium]
MTQKEAIIDALKCLGGKANLNDIYRFAYTRADFSGSKDWKATIRWYLQKETDSFRSSKRGWYELVSYQEEVTKLKQQIANLSDVNKKLESIPKATDLIEKILPEMMDVCKHDRMKADPLRIALRHLGYEEAAGVFDAWISEKEDDLAKAMEKLRIKIHNITMTGESATYVEI